MRNFLQNSFLVSLKVAEVIKNNTSLNTVTARGVKGGMNINVTWHPR